MHAYTYTYKYPSQSELSDPARPHLESSRSAMWRQRVCLGGREGSLWGVLTSSYGMTSVLMLWLLPSGLQIYPDIHLQGKNSSKFHLLRHSLIWQPQGHFRWDLPPASLWTSQSRENTRLLLKLPFAGLTSMCLWQLLLSAPFPYNLSALEMLQNEYIYLILWDGCY